MVKLCLMAMQYGLIGEEEEKLHIFLTSALDGNV
jgi:hypothetical protein